MLIQQMAHEFKVGAKRVDGINAPDVSKASIIIFLNHAMMQLLKSRYGPDNKYGVTLEAIQKRVDEWQRLIVPHELLECEKKSDTLYSTDLTKTEKKYLFMLRVSFLGSKETCKDQKIRSFYSSSDDLDSDLDNPDRRPSFEWRETLHRLAQNQLLAYTSSDFSLTKADIDYLRYPKPLDIKGYKHFDGSDSSDEQCELPDFLHIDIVNEAIVLYKARLNHPDLQAAILASQKDD